MLMWAAAYNDDTMFYQYNEDGTENKYKDIDRDRLVEFTLLRVPEKEEGVPDLSTPPFPVRFSLWLEEGQQLIYRRRTQMTEGGVTSVIHLVGWQQKIADQKVQSISYVPDCEECFAVICAGRWHEDQRAMVAPDFYDCEKELGLNND